jgi:hypothetical protein
MGTYRIRKARQVGEATYVTFICCKLTLCGLQIVATSLIQHKLLRQKKIFSIQQKVFIPNMFPNYVHAMKNVAESYVKIVLR